MITRIIFPILFLFHYSVCIANTQLPTPVGGFYKASLPYSTHDDPVGSSVRFSEQDTEKLKEFLSHLTDNYRKTYLFSKYPQLKASPSNGSLSRLGISEIDCISNVRCYFIRYANAIFFVTADPNNQLIDYMVAYATELTVKDGKNARASEIHTFLEKVVDNKVIGHNFAYTATPDGNPVDFQKTGIFCTYWGKPDGSEEINNIGRIDPQGHISFSPAQIREGICIYDPLKQ